MAIENLPLFQQKKTLIEDPNLVDWLGKKDFTSFSCRYHNIPFKFFSEDKGFINHLEALVPISWQDSLSCAIPVYFISPKSFKIKEESWCDEKSQDCIFDFDSKIAIQRDFVAKEYEDKVVVMAFEEVGDGYHNFMRWFLPRQLLKFHSYVLHSSCLLDKKQKAHYFLGHSGAGKTTITKMSRGYSVLGDDMNILTLKDNQFFASAGAIGATISPDVAYDESFPVASFNWIKQSSKDSRRLLTMDQSRVKLMASISNIFWENLTELEITQIVEDVNSIVHKYKFYELEFTKSSKFWDLINVD